MIKITILPAKNMTKSLSLIILYFFCAHYVLSQYNQYSCYYKDIGKPAREHLVDYEHLQLRVSFDTAQSKVYGQVIHYFKSLKNNLDSLVLDAADIQIDEVFFQNEKIKSYKQQNNLLIIYLPKKLSKDEKAFISIDYTCVPKRGIYFIGWNDSLSFSMRQIWTQGQGIDNRHWIPMFDDMSDKITTDITIIFNQKYQVISNGVLVEKKKLKSNLMEWHYRMNKAHAPYLIMLAIGDYKIKKYKSKNGIEITAYYYPDKEHCADTTFRYSSQMMDFLEKETGVNYPWDKYSIIPVQEYIYGAMENTTATIFGDFFLIDGYSVNDRDFLPVAAHELAHQWFGDYVTAYSNAHTWLQESFATHYNWLLEKEYFGKDHYDWNRKSATDGILKESEKNLNPIAHSAAGTVRIYPKGAYVLHMLKYVTGKELFDASIKRYLNQHAYQNVETNDLMMAIYNETGIYLDWFFDEWIYRGGEPHYQIKFERVEKASESVGIFYIKQNQEFKDNLYVFKMPIEFEIHFTDGSFENKRAMIEDKEAAVEISFPKNKSIAYVLFDPNSNILKKVTFEKPLDMLKNQLAKAVNILDRYDALVEMRTISMDKKRDILQERYYQESFHAMKAEIVKQLLYDTVNANSVEIIRNALLKAHPIVNRAVIENTKKIPFNLKPEFFSALNTTKSYLNIEKLMWILYDNFPNEYQKIIDSSNKLKSNDRNIEIASLSIEYLTTKDKKALKKIILYSSPSFEFHTRINAFNALVKINYIDENVRKYLIQAIRSTNGRLSGPAKEILNYFEKQKRQ